MPVTRRENLRRVLRGKDPGWVPFSPNFAQWFGHHRREGSLPSELRGIDYIQAMKVLGCDLFSRNLDGGFRWREEGVQPVTEESETPLGTRRVTTWKTPRGTLRRIDQQQRAQSTWHTDEYPAKEWSEHGDAVLWLLRQGIAEWDEDAFLSTNGKVGDSGLVNVPIGCSPLRQLQETFGLIGACYLVMDSPGAASTYCDEYWARVMPVIKRLARHPLVESVILMDNVDTPFYPPDVMEQFWVPYVREGAECLCAVGKSFWVHACGKLKALAPQFVAAGITGLEGIAHPPLGDWWIDEAQACHPRFIFNGGFSASEQEMETEEEVRSFYASFLKRADRRRMIFSASCQTNIRTTWDRLCLVREIVRDWGGGPEMD